MSEYKIPGVYIEERSVFPPSVSATATAVPAFLGYTAIEVTEPQKIQSLMEFEAIFGLPPVGTGPVVSLSEEANAVPVIDWSGAKRYHLYYYVEHYFRNGGGPCYVISTGVAGADYPTTADAYLRALDTLKKLDEPTLIVLSDAMATLETTGDYAARHARYFSVVQAALQQCGTLKDRFLILDMPDAGTAVRDNATSFREAISSNPSYAAAYYPHLETTLSRRPVFAYNVVTWKDGSKNFSGFFATKNNLPLVTYGGPATPSVQVKSNESNPELASFKIETTATTKKLILMLNASEKYSAAQLLTAFDLLPSKEGFALIPNTVASSPNDYAAGSFTTPTLESSTKVGDIAALMASQPTVYAKIAAAIAKAPLILPPAPAMAGIYASVDRDRGVWKAPANVGLSATTGPAAFLSRDEQEFLDVDETNGKSINCILKFTGKGVIPWGARTLDASNLDWRYISVRRLFIMAEESVKKAALFAVFEPNDKNTWSKVKAMINNFLYSLWQKGALMGAKPEEAFQVQVGLGETMSAQDVLEGRMIIQVGLAAVRPAEFIILRFSQMQQNN